MKQSEMLFMLVRALEAMLAVNDKRRHPLGHPDEGIAIEVAQAVAEARRVLDVIATRRPGRHVR